MSIIPVSSPNAILPPLEEPPVKPRGRAAWVGYVAFFLLHVACLSVFFTSTSWVAIVLCATCYVIHMFGITAGYHRYFSHRSFKTNRVVQFVFACLGCTAAQGGPSWWVARHRHHHRASDTKEDMHSPVAHGFWWSHVGWLLSRDSDGTDENAVKDLNRYPELRWLNRHFWVPPALLAGLCYLLGGWSGLIWGFLISTVLSHHATFTVNSICHLWGRRRYATPDASRNNLFVAIITLGEGWHNNHHHYQSSARQGFRWWEIDVSYYLIRLLGCFGLVWDVRKPPQKVLAGTIELPASVPVESGMIPVTSEA